MEKTGGVSAKARRWVRENLQLLAAIGAVCAVQGAFSKGPWSHLGPAVAIASFTTVTVFLADGPGYRRKLKAALTGCAILAILALTEARGHVSWMQPDYVMFAAMIALAALMFALIGDFTRGASSDR